MFTLILVTEIQSEYFNDDLRNNNILDNFIKLLIKNVCSTSFNTDQKPKLTSGCKGQLQTAE